MNHICDTIIFKAMKRMISKVALALLVSGANAQMLTYCFTEDGREFEKSINTIIAAFPGNFADITLERVPSKDDSYSYDFYSSVTIADATNSYLTSNLGGNKMKFIATFPACKTEQEAIDWFDYVTSAIRLCEVDQRFVLLETEAIDDDFSLCISWLPINFSGKANEKFGELVVEVALMRLFDFDEEFNYMDTWNVVLRVRNVSENGDVDDLFKE